MIGSASNAENTLSLLLSVLKSADKLGYPCILKIACGGYDGKGQWKFNSRDNVLKMIYQEFNDNEPTEENLKEISDYAKKVFEYATANQ